MKSNAVLGLLIRIGFFDLLRNLMPDTLTVLNYHRIDDPFRPDFNTFKPTVSATKEQFVQQMDYLKLKYNVVSGHTVADWLSGGRPLPPRAAMVTFDDGYYDNLRNGFPALRARNLPAIIFLTTSYIGVQKPFYWDLIAYCFRQTQKESAILPSLGVRQWGADEPSRKHVMGEWIGVLKTLPEMDKKKLTAQLPGLLDVSIPGDVFVGLTLAWSDVRHLAEHGIEMGSHTVNHPILTRVSLEEVGLELRASKERIMAETGEPVLSFAYPNGQREDFNQAIGSLVREAGYQLAFTLLPGPTRYATVKRAPFTIRRIYLRYQDTFPRFVGKLMGASRLRP